MTMPCPTPMPFTKLTELWVGTGPARNYYPNNACQFGILSDGETWGPQEPDVWHLVDLAPYGVPTDAIVAFVSGILVITHGSTPEGAGMKICFRRPGDITSGDDGYICQVGEAAVGNGVRSGCATWIPLTDGKFEFLFSVQTTGNWPLHSSYACNLTLQAWGK